MRELKAVKVALLFAFGITLAFGQVEAVDSERASYLLGIDDVIVIRALDAEEISDKPVRIDMRGNINVPMVGHLHVAGLTVEQLEDQISERLKKYLQEPEVTVLVSESHSQPVSVIGQVTTPGVQQLQGRKNLYEVLSLAGGLKPDAGDTIRITRRKEEGPLPLPTAQSDPTGEFSVADVKVKAVMDAKNPEENILIKANDVISVPKAGIIYVIGAVRKSGGFVMGENQTLSALQIMSLAEGLDRFAAGNRARIMRPVPGSGNPTGDSGRLEGNSEWEAARYSAHCEKDILFVPTNNGKAAAVRGMEAAIGIR